MRYFPNLERHGIEINDHLRHPECLEKGAVFVIGRVAVLLEEIFANHL